MLQQGSLNTYKKLIHNVGTMEGDLLHRQQINDHTALTGKTGSNVITPTKENMELEREILARMNGNDHLQMETPREIN